MEDLPLGRIAALVPEFAVKNLPLGRTMMMMMIYIYIYNVYVASIELRRRKSVSCNMGVGEIKLAFYEHVKCRQIGKMSGRLFTGFSLF